MTDLKKKECKPIVDFENEVQIYIENHGVQFGDNFSKCYKDFVTGLEITSYSRHLMVKDHIAEFICHLKLYSRAQNAADKAICYAVDYIDIESKKRMSKGDNELVSQKSPVLQKPRSKKPVDNGIILYRITFCGSKSEKSTYTNLCSIVYDFGVVEITESCYYTINTYFVAFFTVAEIEFKDLMDLKEKIEFAISLERLVINISDFMTKECCLKRKRQ